MSPRIPLAAKAKDSHLTGGVFALWLTLGPVRSEEVFADTRLHVRELIFTRDSVKRREDASHAGSSSRPRSALHGTDRQALGQEPLGVDVEHGDRNRGDE